MDGYTVVYGWIHCSLINGMGLGFQRACLNLLPVSVTVVTLDHMSWVTQVDLKPWSLGPEVKEPKNCCGSLKIKVCRCGIYMDLFQDPSENHLRYRQIDEWICGNKTHWLLSLSMNYKLQLTHFRTCQYTSSSETRLP